MTFLVIDIFLAFSTLPCFTHDDSYFLLFGHYTPLDPLYTHPHAVFQVLHLALFSRNNKYYIRHLFLLSSSLHKQPSITAHLRSSMDTKTSTAYAHGPPSQFLDITTSIASFAADLDSWMSSNCLSLNPSKTQLIWL